MGLAARQGMIALSRRLLFHPSACGLFSRGKGLAMRAVFLAIVLCLVGVAVWAQTPPETDCDRLAGLWLMPRAAGLAQAYQIRQPQAAVVACEAAITAYPAEPHFLVLLARALIAARSDDTRALHLLSEASGDLPALSAGQTGLLYEFGLAGLAVSDSFARDYFRTGCAYWPDSQTQQACTALAVMKIEGRGGDVDEIGGFSSLQQLCDGGWPMACTNIALQQELRGSDSEAEIVALLSQACEGGDLLACSLLGFRYEIELGVSLDMARARALYTLACDGGEAHGCANLGEVYRSGNGLAQDMIEAVRLFTLACDGDDVFACATLGGILADGRGVPTDIPRAIVVLDRACWQGDPEACDRADGLR